MLKFLQIWNSLLKKLRHSTGLRNLHRRSTEGEWRTKQDKQPEVGWFPWHLRERPFCSRPWVTSCDEVVQINPPFHPAQLLGCVEAALMEQIQTHNPLADSNTRWFGQLQGHKNVKKLLQLAFHHYYLFCFILNKWKICLCVTLLSYYGCKCNGMLIIPWVTWQVALTALNAFTLWENIKWDCKIFKWTFFQTMPLHLKTRWCGENKNDVVF